MSCRTSNASSRTSFHSPMEGNEGPQSQLKDLCSFTRTKTTFQMNTTITKRFTNRDFCSRAYFPDEIDMTFPLLDIWRTFRRNSVGRMSFASLGRVKNWRQNVNFQHVFSVLQQVCDWEVLSNTNRWYLCQTNRTRTLRHCAHFLTNIHIYETCCQSSQQRLH